MIRKILVAGAALAALTGAGIAYAQQQPDAPPLGPGGFMRALDANNDGAITRGEFDAGRATRFAAQDADRNGSLAGDELRRPRGPDGARGGPDGGRGRGDRGERHGPGRMNPDANNDGVITRDEFLAGPIAMFDRMDANDDGRLTDAEKPDMRRMHHRMGRHGGGMRHADANNDGTVTRAEYDAQGAQTFTRMDANSDGQLNEADRAAHRAQRENR